MVYESLVRAGALSRNPDPATASRPFDVDRDGFVMGDGAGIVILERAERARARGAPILARVRGYACVADAYHITSPEPSATHEVRAMRAAIAAAGDAGTECRVVYAHATGTIVGDAAEAKAIDAVYGDRPAIVTSIKGHIGHSMAGAGAMSAIAGHRRNARRSAFRRRWERNASIRRRASISSRASLARNRTRRS